MAVRVGKLAQALSDVFHTNEMISGGKTTRKQGTFLSGRYVVDHLSQVVEKGCLFPTEVRLRFPFSPKQWHPEQQQF